MTEQQARLHTHTHPFTSLLTLALILSSQSMGKLNPVPCHEGVQLSGQEPALGAKGLGLHLGSTVLCVNLDKLLRLFCLFPQLSSGDNNCTHLPDSVVVKIK